MGLQPDLIALWKQMIKLDDNHLDHLYSSERLFPDGTWRKCCSCSSHGAWRQRVAGGKGSQLQEILSMAVFHPQFTVLSFTPAWCLLRTLHLNLTWVVFSNLKTLQNIVCTWKRNNSFLNPNLPRSKGQVWTELPSSPMWKPCLWAWE